MRVAISFDYDSPIGYRESFGKTHYDPASDLKGTEALLKVLAAHDVKTTFAVVGRVALPGNLPIIVPARFGRSSRKGMRSPPTRCITAFFRR